MGTVVHRARITDAVEGVASLHSFIGCFGSQPSAFHADAEIPGEKVLHASAQTSCKWLVTIDRRNAIMRESQSQNNKWTYLRFRFPELVGRAELVHIQVHFGQEGIRSITGIMDCQ